MNDDSPLPDWVVFLTLLVRQAQSSAGLEHPRQALPQGRASSEQGGDNLSTLTALWPVTNTLHVPLEWNQGQEICLLPKLKNCIET